MSENNKSAKPFLKWVGGKTQLAGTFESFYPEELVTKAIKHYCEPFLGGGAVFFRLAQKYTFSSAVLADVNPELVLAYQVVQQHVLQLIERLESIQKQYWAKDDEQRKLMYYDIRRKYNKNRKILLASNINDKAVERASQMIFLNRTCFNGLFRQNASGEFNVPAGRYKKPTVCDANNLLLASDLLSVADIQCSDFRKLSCSFSTAAFIYLDPPYRPISATANFTAYSKNSFNDDDQRALAGFFTQMNQKGHFVMLSNSDPKNHDPRDEFFDDLYNGYHISRVLARRMVNSDATRRGAINEIIVTNYPPQL